MVVLMSPQIILITFLYSSSWPTLFSLFLMIASLNLSIEFRIITNLGSLPEAYPNVQLLTIPWTEVNTRITSLHNSTTLTPPLSEEFPYKLCDFKPMFADLFPEAINGSFDFWGHVDVCCDSLHLKCRESAGIIPLSLHFLESRMI